MLRLLLLACFFCFSIATISLNELPIPKFTVFDISKYGYDNLERFKSNLKDFHESQWWIEVGDKLLVYSKYSEVGATSRQYILRTDDPIFIIPKVHKSEILSLESSVILHHLGFAIIQLPKDNIISVLQNENPEKMRNIIPFKFEDTVLVKQSYNARNLATPERPKDVPTMAAPILTLVNSVSQSRWLATVTTLATYNRYTRGSGIANAQKWITDQLAPLKNITVTLESFTSGSTSGVNIIGTIRGTTTPNNIVIIGGHYDSTSQSPTTAAPGAEDNGSGAAAVLEMARVFNDYPPPSTALFIFYSGEEQGLLGSAAHAQYLVNSGNSSKVKLMHNMDMIAYQQNPSAQPQVILETTTTYTSLFPYYRESATRYTKLGLFESTTAWGSDHESYLKRGMPALLTIDKDWDIYPYYHNTQDTVDKLNPALGYQIVLLGVGAVAQVLGYPF